MGFAAFFPSHLSFLSVERFPGISLITRNMGRGPEFAGSVLCFVHLSFAETDPFYAAEECLFRVTQPNLMSLISTIVVIMAFVYPRGFGNA